MFKRKIPVIIVMILVLCVGILAGCGTPAETVPTTETPQTAETEPAGPTLEMSWLGSHHTTNAMGDVVSGHLLNFYSDGTVRIYYAIKAGMQGHHYGSYEGTWNADGSVQYSYFREGGQQWEQGEFQADFTGEQFQAKVFCMASFPNSAEGGIHYVRINPFEPDMNAEYVYGGSKITDQGAFAALIQLKDGIITGTAAADSVRGDFTGTYEIVYSGVTDIDTPDQLFLRYPVLEITGDSIALQGDMGETAVDFNDTSYISYTLSAKEDAFPKIPMAAIVNQDGNRNDK